MYIRGQRKHVAAAAAAAAPNSAQLPHHFLRSRFTFITDLFFFSGLFIYLYDGSTNVIFLLPIFTH